MTTVLPTTSLEATAFGPAYFVAGINDASSQYILKAAIYNSTQPVPFNLTLPGQTKAAKLTVLTATSPFSVNSPNNTNQVIETITDLVLSEEGTWEWELENWSVALLVVDV
jgi:alpha-N-arabinofuranosidase